MLRHRRVRSLGALPAVITLAVPLANISRADGRAATHWPQFRGPNASGVAVGYPTPVEWDAASGRNILWKTPVPGLGHSSPVIWGDRIFITTAVSRAGESSLKVGLYGDITPLNEQVEHEWKVLCLDKKTGRALWEQTACRGVPKAKRHMKSTHANPTPATDGRHVVAFFGSEGLYCYDIEGTLLWKKDFGVLASAYYVVPPAQWGFASSPVIFDDKVVVQVDVLKDSFVGALDIRDGRELWRAERNDVPTWSTPTVHRGNGRTQVICNGMREIAGYDLATGKQLWNLEGGGDIPVPTPVVAGDLIYVASAHGPAAPVFAIRTSAEGDLHLPPAGASSRYVAWWNGRVGVYMQTLLPLDGRLYCCRDNGVLTVFDALSGEKLHTARLGDGSTGFTASPVAADGKVYFTSEVGDVHVLKAAPDFDVLARNALAETCMATPAISEGVLYFRTRGQVIAVGDAAGGGDQVAR